MWFFYLLVFANVVLFGGAFVFGKRLARPSAARRAREWRAPRGGRR